MIKVAAKWQRWVIAGGALLGLVLGSWLLGPRRAPALRHTSMLNAVFDASWMIGAARLLVIAAAVYLLASFTVRIARGEWAVRAGPLQAEIGEVADDRERLREELRRQHAVLGGVLRSLGSRVGPEAAFSGTETDTDAVTDAVTDTDTDADADAEPDLAARRVVTAAIEQSARTRQTLAASDRVEAQAVPALRRAGYVKDG